LLVERVLCTGQWQKVLEDPMVEEILLIWLVLLGMRVLFVGRLLLLVRMELLRWAHGLLVMLVLCHEVRLMVQVLVLWMLV
jgi:hypothetical protein